MSRKPEIVELLSLSARVGGNPLLVQASSGNTSIKLDGTLWIKASGKWLAHAADEDILVPVDLALLRANLSAGTPSLQTGAWVNGDYLEASIETAMHGVLPYRVVIHVHSVNAISWAVRSDAPDRLAECLGGIRWSWIPYVASGLPLARAIAKAIHAQPGTGVFVLANHGLVIAAESCHAAESLLSEVERRLEVTARANGECGLGASLPLDAASEEILRRGVLYPCQVIFLEKAYVILEGRGIALARDITVSQRAVLGGLLNVVRRVKSGASLRYLSGAEIANLLNEDAHRYQLCTEKNAMTAELSAPVLAR